MLVRNPGNSGSSFLRLWVFILLSLLSGCAALYFDPAEPPPGALQFTLSELPQREYWTGLAFNGKKIGFTHSVITPVDEHWEVTSSASMHLRFLGFDKRIQLQAWDRIDSELRLQTFRYHYDLDGNQLSIEGSIQNGELTADIQQRDQIREQRLPASEAIFPTSVIQLYPVIKGLAVGREYRYSVYNGETQSISTVTQRVKGYESSDLFSGTAYKLKTELHGHSVDTWINHDGLPELELTAGGVLIAYLENAQQARRYLLEAALNKEEALLEYSLIRLQSPLQDPRNLQRLSVTLSGLPPNFDVPTNSYQLCKKQGDNTHCTLRSYTPDESSGTTVEKNPTPSDLAAELAIPANHPQITTLAKQIASTDSDDVIGKMVDWIGANIEPVPQDSFSALDVLESRKAECQGQSYLLTALARARQIPARVVNGLVYSEALEGFAYHTWVEVWLQHQWQAVDPTLGQRYADVTHIKLLEGVGLEQLVPLLNIIGRVRIEVKVTSGDS